MRGVARHPQFNLKTMLAHRATADVALVKLATPLNVAPVPLMPSRPRIAVGERFAVYGYGMAVRGDGKSARPRCAPRRWSLPASRATCSFAWSIPRPAASATGSAPAPATAARPVYARRRRAFAVIGVVSWSTGANGSDGCGGLTGVTPIELYRGWIVETAAKLGSPLAR